MQQFWAGFLPKYHSDYVAMLLSKSIQSPFTLSLTLSYCAAVLLASPSFAKSGSVSGGKFLFISSLYRKLI